MVTPLCRPRVTGEDGVKTMTSGMQFLPQDYDSWTAKRATMPKTSRAIESERWGPSPREQRPKPEDMPQL